MKLASRASRRLLARIESRIESRFESVLWKFRLIAILPVVMTAISSFATFILGTRETLNSLGYMFEAGSLGKDFVPIVLGGFVGGVDLYLVGIALLIFSYGTYELLISSIDPARQVDAVNFKGLLDVQSLDDLKEKLVKVLVVALLVFAFESMIVLKITDGLSLLYYCVALLLLSLCAFLMGRLGHPRS